MFLPQDTNSSNIRELEIKFMQDQLEIYSEYTQPLEFGALLDNLYYRAGEVLVLEEMLPITGFMRKFLEIKKVNVLYRTGEIITRDSEYCNFWLHRIEPFLEPKNIPLDRPSILDEDICLDCNLRCDFRRNQQMTK
jgi:hypothetical protein